MIQSKQLKGYYKRNIKTSINSGFTIVELLVVIVVIGILAAITIVSYTGIRQKAIVASLTSDLDNAAKKLKLYYIDHGSYPTSLDANHCPVGPVDASYCLSASTGNDFTAYLVNNGTNPPTFVLDETNDSTVYRITDDSVPLGTTTIASIGATTGTTAVGSLLTAGALTPGGATVSYQWQTSTTSGGTYTNIAGATASAYTLVAGNLGNYIKVVATGTGSYSGSATSAASAKVTTPLTAIGAITGVMTQGNTLTAGARTPAIATVTYQWQKAITSGGVYSNIVGATASTYLLTAGDATYYIKVVATGTGNYTGSITSAATTVIN